MNPIGKSDLCERILDIVAQKFDVSRDKLLLSSRFSEDLDGDELDQAPLVQAIEQEFSIEIPGDAEVNALTIGDSIKFVGGILGIAGINEYVDQREREELGAAEVDRRQAARHGNKSMKRRDS